MQQQEHEQELVVTLVGSDYEALKQLAKNDLRPPSLEASYLLREVIRQKQESERDAVPSSWRL